MKNIDIICGVCNCSMEDFKCKNCGFEVNPEYIQNFLTAKYEGRIEKIIIENEYSARIYFPIEKSRSL